MSRARRPVNTALDLVPSRYGNPGERFCQPPTFQPIDDRLTIDPARFLSITRISCLRDRKVQTPVSAPAMGATV